MSADSSSPDDSSVPEFVSAESLLDRPVLPEHWLQDLSPEFAHTAQRVMRGIERGDSPARLIQMLEKATSEPERTAAEIAHALFLLPYLIEEPEELLSAWEMTERWSSRFPEDVEVRNLRAAVAGEFRMVLDEWSEVATSEMEEGLEAIREVLPSRDAINSEFLDTVMLDPKSVANRLRAAAWSIDQNLLQDAIKYLHEANELDPGHPVVALRFSECARLLMRSDDARIVLLKSLETNEDAEVLLEAAIVCGETEHWEESIRLSERYEAKKKQPLWARYLRAIACYELGRFDEASQDIQAERLVLKNDEDLHLNALQACIWLRQDRLEQGKALAKSVISQPWVDATNLPEWSLMEALGRLWRALEGAKQQDLAVQLTRRTVVAGIALPEIFSRQRTSEREQTGLRVFDVTIRQELSEHWDEHPGCLPDEEQWEAYEVTWRVLAQDSDDAISRVLEWQGIDQESNAIVVDVKWTGETRDDRPGILYQGKRHEADPV